MNFHSLDPLGLWSFEGMIQTDKRRDTKREGDEMNWRIGIDIYTSYVYIAPNILSSPSLKKASSYSVSKNS